jgi:hypothetical protein
LTGSAAEKRSRSRWNPCSRSPRIGVHDALEAAFTFDWNNQLLIFCLVTTAKWWT